MADGGRSRAEKEALSRPFCRRRARRFLVRRPGLVLRLRRVLDVGCWMLDVGCRPDCAGLANYGRGERTGSDFHSFGRFSRNGGFEILSGLGVLYFNMGD